MSLKLRESWHVTDKYREKRRGRRMNSRVPVRLEWDDGTGKRVSVEAHTRIVNPYGCMVVLQQSLNLEHRLALTNLEIQRLLQDDRSEEHTSELQSRLHLVCRLLL